MPAKPRAMGVNLNKRMINASWAGNVMAVSWIPFSGKGYYGVNCTPDCRVLRVLASSGNLGILLVC